MAKSKRSFAAINDRRTKAAARGTRAGLRYREAAIEYRRLCDEARAAGLPLPRHLSPDKVTANRARKVIAAREAREKARALGQRKPVTKVRKTPVVAHAGYKKADKPNHATTARLIREFAHSVPSEQLERVLQTQPADSPGARLLAVRSDLVMCKWSLERQCAEAGVKWSELVKMTSDHELGKVLMESTRHIGEVVEGVAMSAKARMLVCDLCLNLRDDDQLVTTIEVAHPRIPDTKLRIECPKCGGEGRVIKEGSPRAVETFVRLHGGLDDSQKGAVVVNTQVNFGAQHVGGVQRGQQLLEAGRQRRLSAAPIEVSARRLPNELANSDGHGDTNP